MPTSIPQQISPILDLILDLNPQSVLDIGTGCGKYGMLCREYLDVRQNQFGQPRARIDGIEISSEIITPVHETVYDNMYAGDAASVVRSLPDTYDLALLINILEHIDKESGKEILVHLLTITGGVLAATPKVLTDEFSMTGKLSDRTASQWRLDDFRSLSEVMVIPSVSSWIIYLGGKKTGSKSTARNNHEETESFLERHLWLRKHLSSQIDLRFSTESWIDRSFLAFWFFCHVALARLIRLYLGIKLSHKSLIHTKAEFQAMLEGVNEDEYHWLYSQSHHAILGDSPRELKRALLPYKFALPMASTKEGSFLFYPGDRIIGAPLGMSGEWEPDETALIKETVKEGDLVVDVGANLGWFSIVMAKLVGDCGRVVAIEPELRNFDLLVRNARLNNVQSRVHSLNLALSNCSGEVTLRMNDANCGGHFIELNQNASVYEATGNLRERVRATSLDELFTTHLPEYHDREIGFVKIDCQGAEVSILRGATASLPRIKNLLIEFEPSSIERAGDSWLEFFDLLKPHFARFARAGEEPRSIELIEEEKSRDFPFSLNYFFTKEERAMHDRHQEDKLNFDQDMSARMYAPSRQADTPEGTK